MSRVIKFRAWDTTGKVSRMVSWEEIQDFKVRYAFLDCKEIVMMQFTSLLDKNGKEIYEGDIVRHIPTAFNRRETEGQIVWNNGFAQFQLKNNDANRHWLDSINAYEIIGNIYENPELLK